MTPLPATGYSLPASTAPDAYIKEILRRYSVSPSKAQSAASTLAPFLRQWTGPHYLSHSLSGSFAKGTATTLSADVDIFLSLSAGPTMKDLYFSLYHHCARHALRPRLQNVSIRVEHEGLKVDLVPARKQAGLTTDHTLYVRKKDTWIQTNIDAHIRLISTSNRLDQIRALKIWRDRRFLDFPSFYLELTVLEALHRHPPAPLSVTFLAVLTYLADKFPKAQVTDPANSNNIISDDLSPQEKTIISRTARQSLWSPAWHHLLW
jgi:hypothetical protein